MQMKGRRSDRSVVLGTAVRCRHGAPVVAICAPVKDGMPFPTTFWLTCPHLVHRCAVLESQGSVSELRSVLEQDEAAWRAYNAFHGRIRLALLPPPSTAILRALRPSLWDAIRRGGVGGVKYGAGGGPKCLHLQAASWLALGRHPGEKFLKKTVVPLECPPPGRCTGDVKGT